MCCSIEDIQVCVYELGKKVGAPRSLLLVRGNSPEDGSPHVEINSNGFEYVCSERGCEIYRKHTDIVEELLYWIMSGVVFRLASDYELANRVEGVDFRRLYFSKYISIFGEISGEWKERASNEVLEILESTPYVDGQ
ncbi:immunity 63 family protein [Pseudomonas sp. R3.Fl]|uniref:Imm63 family immunity protein n=1 Tax=Pseudomonas sp. R3.Fl TaxID=2928708 RepID=UPI00201D6194|nr:Imm63 family immunity protein [Pseudomonas sp. R3.Fl]MCL6690862.1 immunity 63 family protein [Pseudomonas sp. R3.Fl]